MYPQPLQFLKLFTMQNETTDHCCQNFFENQSLTSYHHHVATWYNGELGSPCSLEESYQYLRNIGLGLSTTSILWVGRSNAVQHMSTTTTTSTCHGTSWSQIPNQTQGFHWTAGLPGPSEQKMSNHLEKNAKSAQKMPNKLKQAKCCWFWYYQISNLAQWCTTLKTQWCSWTRH